MSSDSHPTKKIKTAPAGPPLYSDLDLARLTFDATAHGAEIKHATVIAEAQLDATAHTLDDVKTTNALLRADPPLLLLRRRPSSPRVRLPESPAPARARALQSSN